MEAIPLPGIDRGPCCDICGYPRLGLPAAALCPECGAVPPELADLSSRTSAGLMTRSDLAWLRCVAVGLILLLSSSAASLRVTLVMPISALSLAAMNVPAPKLHAAALVQCSIGGQPGKWGVSGTLAVLCGVLGIWLLTEPRTIRGDDEAGFSLRLRNTLDRRVDDGRPSRPAAGIARRLPCATRAGHLAADCLRYWGMRVANQSAALPLSAPPCAAICRSTDHIDVERVCLADPAADGRRPRHRHYQPVRDLADTITRTFLGIHQHCGRIVRRNLPSQPEQRQRRPCCA